MRTSPSAPRGRAAVPGAPRRILVLSASMGAGHDAVAGELARRARADGHEPLVADVLGLLPYGLGSALRGSYQASVRHFPWAYGAVYDTFLRSGPGHRPSGVPLARLAGHRLTELADGFDADVVVSVFHLAAQLTGHLRQRGALRVPSAVFVLDFAVHRQWVHPGNDQYLCLTEDAAGELRRGVAAPVRVTGPVVPADFLAPAAGAAHWRRTLARHVPGRPPVLLSAGAWGAASRPSATARLLARTGYLPVVLCGHNDQLRSAVTAVPGALALGWVRDLPGLMGAVHALIDNAAGQTAVQALAAGLPVIGYRPLPGHGEEGVRHMAGLGVSEFAPDEAGLLSALERVLEAGPERDLRRDRGRALFREDPLASVTALAESAAV
ncbi:MGDG synthase family glycosyltransferase [Streptomyces lasalocidi]